MPSSRRILAGVAVLLLFVISLRLARAQGASSISILTNRLDNQRDGLNSGETSLTPTNVNPATFGKLFADTLEGNAYAEPLYVPGVSINGVTHNVIYVATENDKRSGPPARMERPQPRNRALQQRSERHCRCPRTERQVRGTHRRQRQGLRRLADRARCVRADRRQLADADPDADFIGSRYYCARQQRDGLLHRIDQRVQGNRRVMGECLYRRRIFRLDTAADVPMELDHGAERIAYDFGDRVCLELDGAGQRLDRRQCGELAA